MKWETSLDMQWEYKELERDLAINREFQLLLFQRPCDECEPHNPCEACYEWARAYLQEV